MSEQVSGRGRKHRRAVALSRVDQRRAQQGLPPVDALDHTRPVTEPAGGEVLRSGDEQDAMDRYASLTQERARERQLLADVPPHWS